MRAQIRALMMTELAKEFQAALEKTAECELLGSLAAEKERRNGEPAQGSTTTLRTNFGRS